MKKRLLSCLLCVVMVIGMFPTIALAGDEGAPLSGQDGIVEVPEEQLTWNGTTLTGVNESWLKTLEDGTLVSLTIPAKTTSIKDNVLSNNKSTLDQYLYSVDFSQATSLTSLGANTFQDFKKLEQVTGLEKTAVTEIPSQAFYNCENLKIVFDLSGSQITSIGGSAFNGSGITGIILPDGLKTLGASDNRPVFGDCANLEYIRTGNTQNDTTVLLALPGSLETLGKGVFKISGTSPLYQSLTEKGAVITIPASLATVYDKAFQLGASNEKIYFIFPENWTKKETFSKTAFDTYTKHVLIFPDWKTYAEGIDHFGTRNYSISRVVNLTFDGTNRTEKKLYGASIQYVYDEASGNWSLDENYTLPSPPDGVGKPDDGYRGAWTIDGWELTDTSEVKAERTTNDDTLTATYVTTFVAPPTNIRFTVNGEPQGDKDVADQEDTLVLKVPTTEAAPSRIGVALEHALLKGQDDGTNGPYVYFKYLWYDIQRGTIGGERQGEDGFYDPTKYPTENLKKARTSSEITIAPKDERIYKDIGDPTGTASNYNLYRVKIIGYYIDEKNEETKFYESYCPAVQFGGALDDIGPTTTDVYGCQVQVAAELPTITITAMDMGAYTGGESISGDTFPTPRYTVDAPEGVDLSKITFQYKGEAFQVTKENTPVAIGALDEVFIYDEESVKDDAIADASAKSLIALLAGDEPAAENDIEPGEYEITLEDADGITVQGNSAKVEFKPGTLTVRYVSDPERIVSKNDNFSTPALTEAPTAQRENGMAIGVLSEGTEIKTNGLDSLGVLGIEGEAEIHLMFDGLLPAVEGGDGSVREQMLIDRAEKLGYTLTEGQYQHKYLDLINAHDGNAWVTSSQGVDVYWPYPAGTDSSYTFYVLLYDDVNREYGIGTTDKLEEQIKNSPITKFVGTPTDAGVKFHLNEGDFGPCALVWTKTEEPAAKYTVTFKPGDHGTLSGAAADGSVQITGIVSGTKLTAGQIPAVNADGKYSFTGWLGSDGKTYSNSDILALAITSNMTFTGQYKKDSGSGGGGGGGGTTYYTLRYESNGGTEYKDERYARNTVVELDKVPTREGYTFTGWYADEELTERITEIKMTSNKTVYAGWEPTGVPDWLNGKDHFAYVVGYTDGTVRPLNNISRAEVATIFFRLLNEDIREENLTTSNTFADVNEGMWCNTAISTMAKLGIVKGRSQEHFDPDAPITRAEFAAIFARFDTSKRYGDSDFTDIAGHWAEAEIERAATLGWIIGYTDSTFRPENYITRAEAMTMINRVLNRLPESEDDLLDGMNVWPDNQPGAWYYLAVQEATNSHDFNRKGDVHEHWTKLTADPDWTKYQ